MTPPFWPALTFFSRAVSLLGFLGFFVVHQGYCCVGRLQCRFFCSALRSAALLAFFFPNFAIFALVSDPLRNFSFYSWASLLVLPSLLRLPILLSLSPMVTSLGGFSCSPPSLVIPVFLCLEIFLSVAAVLCLLLPPPARGDVGSCCSSLVCLFSLSWNTCGFSAQCHAVGGPSGVPLLADSGWLLYSCGCGFAWGWGLSCACTASPSAASPSGFCPLTEWVGMSVSSLLVYS